MEFFLVLWAFAALVALVGYYDVPSRIHDRLEARSQRKALAGDKGVIEQSAAEILAGLDRELAEVPVYNTYGHPWAPIPDLKGKLVRPPEHFGWEITAVINGFGNPALRLALLDLRSSEVTDFTERDMVVIRRWQYANDDTFVAFYRKAGAHDEELCRKVYFTHLIQPLADWARTLVAHKAVVEPPALCVNYALVGRTEERVERIVA